MTTNAPTPEEILEQVRLQARNGVPFAHFQMFYESTERVTDRRLNLNRTNASLATLIAAGMGTMAAWAYDKPAILPLAMAFIFFIGVLAALFCRWWWQQVEDYKALNSSKFDVLAEMAKHVVFFGEYEGKCGFDPFFWEWALGKAKNDLAAYKGGFALGSTWSELVVPKAFLFMFLSGSVIAGGMLVKGIIFA